MRYRTSQSGFSLVETLVAISLLLIIIIGPMTISSSAARSTSYSSEQVIAFFLAQEGAELAQKARDDMILRNFLPTSDANYEASPWADFTNDTSGPYEECFDVNVGCGLELNTDAAGTLQSPVVCSGSNCRLYYVSGNRATYTHTSAGASSTPFTRVIKMEEIDGREVRVISQVYWRSGDQRAVQQVQVETYLFNVYGN